MSKIFFNLVFRIFQINRPISLYKWLVEMGWGDGGVQILFVIVFEYFLAV